MLISEMFGQKENTVPSEVSEARAKKLFELCPNIKVSNVAEFESFINKLNAGQLTADEIKAAFYRFKESYNAIAVEVGKLTKKALLDKYGGFHSRMSDSKPSLVKRAMQRFLNVFIIPTGSGFISYGDINFVERQIEGWSQEKIVLLVTEYQKELERREERQKEIIKTLTNPETLEEFENCLRFGKGIQLTPEQMETYELLKARKNQELRDRQAAIALDVDTSKIQLPEGVTLLEPQKTQHTRTGEDLFVIQLSARVDRELYNSLNRVAKVHGGFYSSYSRSGAIPGWQFKDEESAIAFCSLESKSGEERLAQKRQWRENKAQEHLQELIESMREEANEILGRDRKVNTYRRQNIARSVERSAFQTLQLADTMDNICTALSDESLQFLRRIYFRTDFEILERMVYRAKYARLRHENIRSSDDAWHDDPCDKDLVHINFPSLEVNAHSLSDICNYFATTNGIQLLAKKFKKMIAPEKHVIIIPFREIENFKKFISRVKKHRRSNHWSIRYALERINEPLRIIEILHRLHIFTTPELRVALREYVLYRGSLSDIDPLTKMRRDLISLNFKEKGVEYFPTPRHVVETMLEFASIQDGQTLLEPSAGSGHILEIVEEYFPNLQITAVENHIKLQNILDMCGYGLIRGDFLSEEVFPKNEQGDRQQFDRILANPPFSDCDKHIYKMYECLSPGGVLVSVVGEGLFMSSRRCLDFATWLQAKGGYTYKLEEGSFKESDNSTSVNTRLVVIHKSI